MANVNNKNQQRSHIAITGELTIYTAMKLKDQLLTGISTTKELELNLSEVDEIDASGLQLLVMIKQQAAILGNVLLFTAHSPVVVELIDLSGLAGFFGDPLLMTYTSTTEGKSI